MADNGNTPLLTEKAVAERCGVTPSMLIAARFRGRPLIPFVRFGGRLIRYRLVDVNEYIERNRQTVAARVEARIRAMSP